MSVLFTFQEQNKNTDMSVLFTFQEQNRTLTCQFFLHCKNLCIFESDKKIAQVLQSYY